MSAATSIEWTDRTWNPVRGCARVSRGCENCYAERVAYRFGQKPGSPYEGLTVLGKKGPRWKGDARFVPEMLEEPLRWKKPQRIFVNSMSDLFHDDITNEQIAAVFGVMAACPQHTFQILTKRPERARAWFDWLAGERERRLAGAPPRDPALPPFELTPRDVCAQAARAHGMSVGHLPRAYNGPWPLPNVWLGVSTEDQQRADERIPLLLRCPAAVRFVSAEPLLGPIDFEHIGNALFDRQEAIKRAMYGAVAMNREQAEDTIAHPQLDWVIVGGESGPGARPCDVRWIRSIVEQCKAANVACFVKQLGARPWNVLNAPVSPDLIGSEHRLRNRKGGDMAEFPVGIAVREFPGART